MDTRAYTYGFLVGALRVALLGSLVWAGWAVYRELPGDGAASPGGASPVAETSLLIVLRGGSGQTVAAAEVPVELFQTDIGAVWREYYSEPRPGVRFEDFLARRLKGRPSVKARLDGSGRATVSVAPGRWFIHLLLPGTENTEWRLPVDISGRTQIVELT
ncbi:MAG TPA: hypothetical protein VF507_00285, partial [Pyrinomonadaceae bacterium]